MAVESPEGTLTSSFNFLQVCFLYFPLSLHLYGVTKHWPGLRTMNRESVEVRPFRSRKRRERRAGSRGGRDTLSPARLAWHRGDGQTAVQGRKGNLLGRGRWTYCVRFPVPIEHDVLSTPWDRDLVPGHHSGLTPTVLPSSPSHWPFCSVHIPVCIECVEGRLIVLHVCRSVQ